MEMEKNNKLFLTYIYYGSMQQDNSLRQGTFFFILEEPNFLLNFTKVDKFPISF